MLVFQLVIEVNSMCSEFYKRQEVKADSMFVIKGLSHPSLFI